MHSVLTLKLGVIVDEAGPIGFQPHHPFTLTVTPVPTGRHDHVRLRLYPSAARAREALPNFFLPPLSLTSLLTARLITQRRATLASASSGIAMAIHVRSAMPPWKRPTRVADRRKAEASSCHAARLRPPPRCLNDGCTSPASSGSDATSVRTTPAPRCFPHSSRHPAQAEVKAC
jgi:hypothetical protein